MKIPFKKKLLNTNLVFVILWLILIFIKISFDVIYWVDSGWIAVSLLYLINAIYQKKYPYILFKNGYIYVNGPLGKSMNLSEIKQIKKFTGDYILKTDKKELTINTEYLDPESREKLVGELKKLEVVCY